MRYQPKLWDNQRERERERERVRENYPAKSPNLRHCQACSQNKGLSEYQRRASQLWTGPFPTRGREAGGGQPEPERGNLSPRDSILYQTATGSQLLTKTSGDSGWLTSAGGVATRDQLPRRTTWHTYDRHFRCHPGN